MEIDIAELGVCTTIPAFPKQAMGSIPVRLSVVLLLL